MKFIIRIKVYHVHEVIDANIKVLNSHEVHGNH